MWAAKSAFKDAPQPHNRTSERQTAGSGVLTYCHIKHYLPFNAPHCSITHLYWRSQWIYCFFFLLCNVYTVCNDRTQVLNEASALLFCSSQWRRRPFRCKGGRREELPRSSYAKRDLSRCDPTLSTAQKTRWAFEEEEEEGATVCEVWRQQKGGRRVWRAEAEWRARSGF